MIFFSNGVNDCKLLIFSKKRGKGQFVVMQAFDWLPPNGLFCCRCLLLENEDRS